MNEGARRWLLSSADIPVSMYGSAAAVFQPWASTGVASTPGSCASGALVAAPW